MVNASPNIRVAEDGITGGRGTRLNRYTTRIASQMNSPVSLAGRGVSSLLAVLNLDPGFPRASPRVITASAFGTTAPCMASKASSFAKDRLLPAGATLMVTIADNNSIKGIVPKKATMGNAKCGCFNPKKSQIVVNWPSTFITTAMLMKMIAITPKGTTVISYQPYV